jgi:hypothetical protein
MRAARFALAFACLLATGLLAAGCGSDSDSGATGGGAQTAAEGRPAPPADEFPQTLGRSLKEVMKSADGPAELVVSPAAMVFYPGENRYPFGVRERKGGEVTDAEVAIYISRVPPVKSGARSESGNRGQVAKAESQGLDEPALGPFTAETEALGADPAFRARTTATGPEAASVVYSAAIDFPSAGDWRIAALIKHDGEIQATLLTGAQVGEFKRVPRAGDRAPQIHTPTTEDVDGDLSKITTRVPPDTQNTVDYADALGKEPIVLLFATPKFCQSRVCGPVVDETEQAKHEHGDQAAFIHMEIYDNNDPADGVRPQVRAFHLPSEPWLFTIDRRGIVREAIEGAFGSQLLDEAIGRAVTE